MRDLLQWCIKTGTWFWDTIHGRGCGEECGARKEWRGVLKTVWLMRNAHCLAGLSRTRHEAHPTKSRAAWPLQHPLSTPFLTLHSLDCLHTDNGKGRNWGACFQRSLRPPSPNISPPFGTASFTQHSTLSYQSFGTTHIFSRIFLN
jgi:hypothetical protein